MGNTCTFGNSGDSTWGHLGIAMVVIVISDAVPEADELPADGMVLDSVRDIPTPACVERGQVRHDEERGGNVLMLQVTRELQRLLVGTVIVRERDDSAGDSPLTAASWLKAIAARSSRLVEGSWHRSCWGYSGCPKGETHRLIAGPIENRSASRLARVPMLFRGTCDESRRLPGEACDLRWFADRVTRPRRFHSPAQKCFAIAR
jgi:hypothetical protein